MREIFRFFAKKRLSPNRVEDTIGKWNSSKTLDFLREVREKLKPHKTKQSSDYSFVANTQLSGGKLPCAALDCRLKHVDQLARFAALYADEVLIQDPFENYDRITRADVHIREAVSNDVRLLFYLRPLLEGGLISLATTKWYYCDKHYDETIVRTRLYERLEKAKRALTRRLTRDTEVILDTGQIHPVFKVTGPEQLIEHGVLYRISNAAQRLAEQWGDGQNHLLTKRQIKNYHIFDGMVSTIVRDMFLQNLYAQNGFRYLTDREIDFEVISAINNPAFNRRSKVVLEALSHTVPFIKDVQLDRLAKLRRDEGESFEVYRDSLNGLLQSFTDEDVRNVRLLKQAFNDSIRPELHKIELTVKKARTLLYGSIKQDVLFSAGFIGLGLFSGLLPTSAGEIIATLGGISSHPRSQKNSASLKPSHSP